MHYVLQRSIFPQITLNCLRFSGWICTPFVKSLRTGMISMGISTNFHNICVYVKRAHIHQKFGFIMSNIWFETSFHNSFGKWSLCKNVKKKYIK